MEEDLLGLQTTTQATSPQTTSSTQVESTKAYNRPQKTQYRSLKLSGFRLLLKDKSLIYHFNNANMPNVVAKKVVSLVNTLNTDVIDIHRLKECLSEGIPDEAAVLREYSWKLVLGFLPSEKSRWQEATRGQVQTYRGLVKMFLAEQKFGQYPLVLKKGHTRFQELESDYLLWQQIEKDTSRTHSQYSFFSTECKEIMIPYLTSARRQKFKLINGQDQLSYQQFLENKQKQRKTYRYDYMTRILYIYARLNPRIQYVQGMNQILAPIFYLVNINKPVNLIEEASCFFMFNNAISDIIDLHIKDLDKSHSGIYGKLNQVNEMLVVIEPMVWSRLQKLKIDPFFYCFRWVTLLYAQDFDLFDTLRIWQSIFSSQDRAKFISFIAIGIIIACKQVIIRQDFSVVLQYLQNIRENVNVNKLIDIANGLYLQFKDKDFAEHAMMTKKALIKKSHELDSKGDENGSFFKKISNFVSQYF